jgi:hypothetical protein
MGGKITTARARNDFGLAKSADAPLPMTLILDSDLRALGVLTGRMGSDFPQVLWGEL